MKQLQDKTELQKTIQKMAQEIVALSGDPKLKDIALVGIRTRGVLLADRLAFEIKKQKDIQVETGILDITLYRDDLSQLADAPLMKSTDIRFALEGKTVVLVDDVLYTGRTIRCALDALFDLGRPGRIALAVAVVREGRELPIQADVCGLEYFSKPDENIKVMIDEIDGEDSVKVIQKSKSK